MRKILNFLFPGCLVLLTVTACSHASKPEVAPQGSVLEDLPFVYKMTVQQGNIITKDMVDKLEIGMNRRQVQYILGTPLLTDFFHANRWDYSYTIQRGHKAMETRHLTLFFQDDNLVRIQGDVKPDPVPKSVDDDAPREIVVPVPDYTQRKGIITKALHAIGAESD